MNDPVDRVLADRQALDRGFPAGLVLSVGAHLLLVGAAVAAPLLAPKKPLLDVATGFAVPLPPGGRGSPSGKTLEPAPPTTLPPAPEPKPAKVEAPKIQKPPKETPKKGLPEPDARRRGRAEKSPPPARSGSGSATAAGAQKFGVEFAPAGAGVPEGTDPFGDLYMAGVQQKIWMTWTHNRPLVEWTQAIVVNFTLLADGSVTDVEVVQSSGVTLLDLAAKRAIYSGAPYGQLPKKYGNRFPIQAKFRPTR